MFAGGEGEEVVRGKHIGQTAVVCDHSRDDAKVTSELDNVVLLVEEACELSSLSGLPLQKHGIRTNR